MEQKLTLLPLVGMEWQGQTLPFGASPQEADGVLGTPDQAGENRRYYFDSELRLDFDRAGRLEFIECMGGPEATLQPELYGLPVFQTDAEELTELLKEKNGGDPVDEEEGFSYAFPAISVGLYRELTPAAVDEMVRELARIDLTAMSEFNLAAEILRAHRWETVGIGRENYYE